MSVDSAIEAAPGEPEATPDPTASFRALFPPRPRIEAEPGVWSLLLVPVLVCVAMLVFVTVAG